jgi:DNA-directed RNA polymerase subunit RPC12/RpoP
MRPAFPVLSPIERPRCTGCGTRMSLSRIDPCNDHSEKRTFDCPKCDHIETVVAGDPLQSMQVTRLTERIWPPT